MLSSVDWTNVLDSLIAGLPAILTALGALLYARRGSRQAVRNAEQLQTPSGDPIGHVVERAHDLAAVATLAGVGAARAAGAKKSPVEATGNMDTSVRRLNTDERSPVHVNGEEEVES